MKNQVAGLLIAIFCLGLSFESNAQLSKGTLYIGPSFSMRFDREEIFDINGLDNGHLNQFVKSGQTEFGFALANNFFLGLEMVNNIDHRWTSGLIDELDYRTTFLRLGGGPVIGYRIPIVGNLYLPVDASFVIGPSIVRSKPDSFPIQNDTDLFTQVSARFGVEYLIDGKVGVFVKGGPTLVTEYDGDDADGDIFVSSRFGVNFYLNPEMRRTHMEKKMAE